MKLSIPFCILLFCTVLQTPAFAAKSYDIKVMTPEVQQAINARQARYDEVKALKALSQLGENNQGYVSVLGSDSKAQKLAKVENQNRKTIYQTIVSQNQLGPGGMEAVEAVFAEVQRERAASGEAIQLPSGKWASK